MDDVSQSATTKWQHSDQTLGTQTDSSFTQAALRETDEELGISPSSVEVLGQIGPPEMDLRGRLRVWPIVVSLKSITVSFPLRKPYHTQGFVHAQANSSDPNLDEDAVLPSLDMDAVRSRASKDEVGTAFHLPLSMLVAPARLKPTLFRGTRPYWSIDVTDIVSRYCDLDLDPNSGSVDEVGSGVGGKVEVWGLTGWYLSLMLRKLRIYQ